MLENRIIKKSNSSYTFNIIVVEKKNRVGEEMNRLCINYELLNKIIILDKYLLFNINKIVDFGKTNGSQS